MMLGCDSSGDGTEFADTVSCLKKIRDFRATLELSTKSLLFAGQIGIIGIVFTHDDVYVLAKVTHLRNLI